MAKKIQNAKDDFTEVFAKRLEQTQIECTNGLRVIKSRDHVEAFHFVDPPYIGTDCGHYAGAFTEANFIELCELLTNVEGKFMLTMFPHPILDEFIKSNGWQVSEVERTISASKIKRRKQSEVIVMNYLKAG